MQPIIPAPQQMNRGAGKLVLGKAINIEANPETERASKWLHHGLGVFAGITPSTDVDATTIRLRVDESLTSDFSTLGVRADDAEAKCELHQITITTNGVEVIGVSPEAVFRGATTVLHLISQANGSGYAELQTGTITDTPLFAWRGLSFDTVRCFHPVETIKKTLDLLALYKMNVFHFHLTDTEGWRFQVDEWELLTEVSGKTARNDRPGGFYTTEQFAEIVRYAADRYITVVPEFDSPGHTASVIAAYPDLVSDDIRSLQPNLQYLPAGSEKIDELLAAVYGQLLEQVNGNRLHIGGDEALLMDHHEFLRYVQRALEIARSTGGKPIVWQEAARGKLQPGDLAQWWIPDHLLEQLEEMERDQESPHWQSYGSREVAKALIDLFRESPNDIPHALADGAAVILSPATWFYLDTEYVEPSADSEQAAQFAHTGLTANRYGNGTVEEAFEFDPFTLDDRIPADKIAGLEAAVWCEFIEDADDLFFQLLPRLAGIAEKAWNASQDWNDYRPRLQAQPHFWDAMELSWFKSSIVW